MFENKNNKPRLLEIIKLLVHTMYSIKKLLKDKLIAQDILTQFIAQQHKSRAKTICHFYIEQKILPTIINILKN